MDSGTQDCQKESTNITEMEPLPLLVQMPTMYFSQHMPIMHSSHQSQNPMPQQMPVIAVTNSLAQSVQMPLMYFSQQMPIMHSSQYLHHPTTQQMPFIAVTDSSSHSVHMPVHSSQHVQHSSTSASQKESGASSTIRSFVPDVEEEKIPRVGMLVDSIEEAYNLYNIYARAAGFRVRKSYDARRKNKVVWKKFVCSKEGQKVEKMCYANVVQRRVVDIRENCGAELQVKRNASG